VNVNENGLFSNGIPMGNLIFLMETQWEPIVLTTDSISFLSFKTPFKFQWKNFFKFLMDFCEKML